MQVFSVHRASTTSVKCWAAPLLAVLLVVLTLLHLHALHLPVQMWNFSYTYAASQCLADGCNPYDASALNRNAEHRGAPLQVPVTRDSAQYPPSTLLLAAPLGSMAWPTAEIVFTALTALMLAAAFTLLLLQAARSAWWMTLALLVASLAGRAFLQGLVSGNLAVLCAACLSLACILLLERDDRPAKALGTLLLILAVILKPQLAIGAVVLLLAKRETRMWTAAALAISVLELGAATAAFAIRLGSLNYLRSLADLTRFAVSKGQMLDPSPANPAASMFLQMQALLLELPGIDVHTANTLTLLFVAALAATVWWLARRGGLLQRRPWTLLAFATLLTLLPLYHRQYDRVLVLLVLPMAIEMAHEAFAWRTAFALAVAGWMTWDPILERLLHHQPGIAWSVVFELGLCALLLANLYRDSQTINPNLIAS